MPTPKRTARAVILALTSFACAAPLAACSSAPPPDDANVQMPSKQFILENLSIEERRGGELLWSGTAERADGDLSTTEVENVRLVHPGPQGGQGPLTITAPTGELDLDGAKADFHDVRVTDPQGGELTASAAHYDGKAKTLDVDGPLDFRAEGLTAHATSAVVKLDTGTMDIRGPVVGRFVKPPQRPR